MLRAGAICLGFAFLLSGCGTPPQNPAEFRADVVKGGESIDKFVVNRPYGQVVQTFKKMTPECLNFQMGNTYQGSFGTSRTKIWGEGRGRFRVSGNKAELTLQRKVTDQIGNIPEDGMYFLVADVEPAGAGKTRVTTYYDNSVEGAAQAVKAWASGDNLSCPDQSRLFR